MKKAINRFWDWIFHPSIRIYTNQNSKASIFRYPSPGNAPKGRLADQQYIDYKTPFEYTEYNIRYKHPIPSQIQDRFQQYIIDPIGMSSELKLIRAGLLKKGQESNIDAVANAKRKYLAKYGAPVEKKVYKNDSDQPVLKSKSRQEIASFIEANFRETTAFKKSGLAYEFDRKTIDDPEIVPIESVDLYTAPHFQQGRIENEYMIEQQITENMKRSFIDMNKGQARFWKAIDDSHNIQQVQKVQRHIGDQEPTNFQLRKAKVVLQLDKNGKVVDVHPKSVA